MVEVRGLYNLFIIYITTAGTWNSRKNEIVNLGIHLIFKAVSYHLLWDDIHQTVFVSQVLYLFIYKQYIHLPVFIKPVISYNVMRLTMMTSANRKIFHITGPLCGNSPVSRDFPSKRAVMKGFVFFDLRPNKQLSKQSRRRWFEMPSCSLWRHCNDEIYS